MTKAAYAKHGANFKKFGRTFLKGNVQLTKLKYF